MHLGVLAHQDGAQQVVQTPHHQTAESRQGDAGAHLTLNGEDDRGRQPHQGGTHVGDGGQDRHDRSPEDRVGDAGHGEGDAGQGPLQQTDQQRATQRSPGHRGELLQHHPLIDGLEREVVEEPLDQLVTIHLQEIQAVEEHKEHKDEAQGPQGERGQSLDREFAQRRGRLGRLLSDLAPVRGQLVVERQAVQQPGEGIRLGEGLLHPQARELTHVQGLGDEHPGQEDQRDQDHHRHEGQAGQRGQGPPSPEQIGQALVQGLGQSAEDARQEQGHHERLDHGKEECADPECQEQHDRLVDSVLWHEITAGMVGCRQGDRSARSWGLGNIIPFSVHPPAFFRPSTLGKPP